MEAHTAKGMLGLSGTGRADTDDAPEDLRATRETYRAVSRRCVQSLTLANLVGGTLVFALGVFVVPSPHVDNLAELNRLNAILFAVVLTFMLVLGTWLSVRMARRSSAWLLEGRDPTPDELAETINYPKRQALMEAGLWLIALVPFTVLNASYSLTLGLSCALEILLGGLTTCVLTYLLCEWLSRPVVAHALARAEAAPTGASCPGVASRLTLAWIFGATVPLVAVVLVGVTVLSGVSASAERIGVAVVVLGSVGVLVGLVVIVTAARGLTQPLNSLRGALGRVERGDLSAVVEVDDASEIGRLQAGFNRMVAGLRERERLRDLFGRQVGRGGGARCARARRRGAGRRDARGGGAVRGPGRLDGDGRAARPSRWWPAERVLRDRRRRA